MFTFSRLSFLRQSFENEKIILQFGLALFLLSSVGNKGKENNFLINLRNVLQFISFHRQRWCLAESITKRNLWDANKLMQKGKSLVLSLPTFLSAQRPMTYARATLRPFEDGSSENYASKLCLISDYLNCCIERNEREFCIKRRENTRWGSFVS